MATMILDQATEKAMKVYNHDSLCDTLDACEIAVKEALRLFAGEIEDLLRNHSTYNAVRELDKLKKQEGVEQ